MERNTVGQRIREQRKSKHLTLEELADLSSLSPNFLGDVERGKRNLSLESFIAIVNALNISADLLIRDSVSSAQYVVDNEISEKIKALNPAARKMCCEVIDAIVKNLK